MTEPRQVDLGSASVDAAAGTSAVGSGARALLLAQGCRALLQVASVTLLSRLLTPADFGEFAVVVAVVTIASVVGDLGLSVAAVREPILTRAQWNALFWVNTAVGAVLTAVVAAASPTVASLVGYPEVRNLLLTVSPIFLLNGMSVQYRVEITRRGRFVRLAAIETLAPALGLVVGVSWALISPSSWALVAQQVAGAGLLTAAAMAFVRRVPRMPGRRSGVRRLVTLGGVSALSGALNAISLNVAPLALGRAFPAAVVGAFSRASQLSFLAHNNLATPLTRVVVPSLAEAQGSEAFHRRFRKALIAYGMSVGVFTALLGGLSESVVAIALGSQWVKDAPSVLLVLSVGLLLHTFTYVAYWSVLAAGDTRRLFLCDAPGQVVAIIGIVVAARFGADAVAWATVAGSAVRVTSYLVLGLPAVGISPRFSLRASLPVTSLCASVLLGCRLLEATPLRDHPWLAVGAGIMATAVIVGLHWLIVPSARTGLADTWHLGLKIAGGERRRK